MQAACAANRPDIVEVLLEHGVKASEALQSAAQLGSFAVCDMLISKKGGSLDEALSVARLHNRAHLVEQLGALKTSSGKSNDNNKDANISSNNNSNSDSKDNNAH